MPNPIRSVRHTAEIIKRTSYQIDDSTNVTGGLFGSPRDIPDGAFLVGYKNVGVLLAIFSHLGVDLTEDEALELAYDFMTEMFCECEYSTNAFEEPDFFVRYRK